MSAWEDYYRVVLDLHARAGAPSSREIARRSGSDMSHTTANHIIRGKRLPGRAMLRKFLTGIGVEEADQLSVLDLWLAAYQELTGALVSDPPPASPRPPMSHIDAAILAELKKISGLLEELVLRQRGEL